MTLTADRLSTVVTLTLAGCMLVAGMVLGLSLGAVLDRAAQVEVAS